MKTKIEEQLRASLRVKEELVASSVDVVAQIVTTLIDSLKAGGKVLLCGNGGSAADAQHLAAEFVGRFARERRALPAIALSTNTSVVTAIANDYGFEKIFSRQVEALARKGDVLVGLSASGNSANVLEAMKTARKMGCTTIGFTGRTGGAMKPLADVCLCVPSDRTRHIQEAHITVGHVVCDLVEEAVCGD
ncbi:MAG TPA: D-sedoheptulose 7-phosphate isomerase [Planctomycetota bacterium]|nr:D-sedoheptulose 7-phosphate isomerase [Planctomycetota bacterium]